MIRPRLRGPSHLMRPRHGFGYVALLVVLAMLAMTAAASLRLGAASHRRLAEQALLETGATFSAALASYARATPRGQPDAPPSLQSLLRDPRVAGQVRHLRRIPIDPMTGSDRWGLMRMDDADDGAIVGVYSLARGQPLKRANFDSGFAGFENRQSYAEWLFVRPPDPNAAGLRRGLVDGGALRSGDPQPSPPALPSPVPELPETGIRIRGL